jgi:hypothetical protein
LHILEKAINEAKPAGVAQDSCNEEQKAAVIEPEQHQNEQAAAPEPQQQPSSLAPTQPAAYNLSTLIALNLEPLEESLKEQFKTSAYHRAFGPKAWEDLARRNVIREFEQANEEVMSQKCRAAGKLFLGGAAATVCITYALWNIPVENPLFLVRPIPACATIIGPAYSFMSSYAKYTFLQRSAELLKKNPGSGGTIESKRVYRLAENNIRKIIARKEPPALTL